MRPIVVATVVLKARFIGCEVEWMFRPSKSRELLQLDGLVLRTQPDGGAGTGQRWHRLQHRSGYHPSLHGAAISAAGSHFRTSWANPFGAVWNRFV